MKFTHTAELLNFIKKNNKLFNNLEKLDEIYTGGSSYNFRVQTAENTYLLKLISEDNYSAYLKLSAILATIGQKFDLEQDKFLDYNVLVMPYINGRRLKYSDCSAQFLASLFTEYQKIQNLDISSELISPQQKIDDVAAQINTYLAQDKSLIGVFIKKFFWNKIEPKLIRPSWQPTIIHGDFTANNIFTDGKSMPHILDFGSLRYGYEVEDMTTLFLQLSGFRGFWGRIGRFQRLKENFTTFSTKTITPQMWLYGIQLFYLNNLLRRLATFVKSKRSLRKDFCLFISLMGYFRFQSNLDYSN